MLVIALLLAGLIVGGTAEAASTVETIYAAWGGRAVSTTTVTDASGGVHTVFYPTTMGVNPTGYKHPIITFGSTLSASSYAPTLTHLASWGFVVVNANTTSPSSGAMMLAGAQKMVALNATSGSIFYQKLDAAKVAAAGHDQGSQGAIKATLNSGGLIKTTAAISFRGGDIGQISNWAAVTAPVQFFWGSIDWFSDQTSQDAIYNGVSVAPASKGVANGAGRDDLGTGNKFRGYLTAWFKYSLECVADAQSVFVGGAPEINTNTNWLRAAQKRLVVCGGGTTTTTAPGSTTTTAPTSTTTTTAPPPPSGTPVENKYKVAGTWAVTSEHVTDGGGTPRTRPDGTSYSGTPAGCQVFRPTTLGTGGFKHAIITWGNGTDSPPSNYTATLTHLASWGFVVIASDNQRTGWGDEMWACAKWMKAQNAVTSSIYYQKLDPARVGSAGHSQGATGALVQQPLSGGTITSTAAIELVNPGFFSPQSQLPTMSQITQKTFLMSVSSDGLLCSQTEQTNWYNQLPGPAAKGMVNDSGGHSIIQQANNAQLGYLTAWFMYTLKGTADARTAFVGTPPEMNANPKWGNAAEKNLT